MLEINLLPEDIKKKKRSAPKLDASSIVLPKLPVINIAAIAVGALLAIQAVLFVIGVISGIFFNSMSREYKDILPKKLEAERLKIQADNTNRKAAAIDELMVKQLSTTP